jgi:hypothetical protein
VPAIAVSVGRVAAESTVTVTWAPLRGPDGPETVPRMIVSLEVSEIMGVPQAKRLMARAAK